MKTPKISILLPTYKTATYIERAIESVRAQSFRDWELILIDDGLETEAVKVINGLRANDERIIYIKNESNLGIQKSLNKGLRYAQGIYIARIDDDDEWIDKEKIEKQIRFLEQNQEHVLVGANAKIENDKGETLGVYKMPETDREIRQRILSKNCFLHSSILASKDKIIEVGGYPESIETLHIEDYALWLRLGLLGKFANLPSVSVKIMVHLGSLTSQNRFAQVKRIIKLTREYRSSYPGFWLGQFALFLRLVGFAVIKNLPVGERLFYKIQQMYKQI